MRRNTEILKLNELTTATFEEDMSTTLFRQGDVKLPKDWVPFLQHRSQKGKKKREG